MREIVLRDFFLGRASPLDLATDVLGSVKRVGPISFVVEVEDMDGEFTVTREMLVSLCDAVLSGQLSPQELSPIGFALLASDAFIWDAEDVAGDIIHDWSCPEINFALTVDNVQRFRKWLLNDEPYPAKRHFASRSKQERLISKTEKKSVPRRRQ